MTSHGNDAAIIVHGGAWDGGHTDAQIEAGRNGCVTAAEAGWRVLSGNGSAVDAVEVAIQVLEDDPAFDAGRGSFLNADGRIQLDAAIMTGKDLNTGAVAALERIRHPISAARKVLETEWAYLVGDGALHFARAQGLEERDPWWFVVPEELERWTPHAGSVLSYLGSGEFYRRLLHDTGDTVGAVAIDRAGHIVAGTSTGGAPNKPPGRVGDSSLIGCGLYADDLAGGVASSGPGELIIRAVLAKFAADAMEGGASAQEAVDAALAHLDARVGGIAGLIAIDHAGRIGRAHTTRFMTSAAMRDSFSEPRLFA